MKNAFLLLLLPLISFGQDATYDLTSFNDPGIKAPNVHHTGEAWLNFLMQSDETFPYHLTQATFEPGATLDWHKHATPQVLIVTEGKGYYQERGKAPIIIQEGDVLKCNSNTEHWHTSSAKESVTYIAIYGASPTEWTEKMTQEYYDEITAQLKPK